MNTFKDKAKNLKIGDTVKRTMGVYPNSISMDLTISEITKTEIVCGAWKFSRKNGAEIDEDLNWNEKHTGSYLEI